MKYLAFTLIGILFLLEICGWLLQNPAIAILEDVTVNPPLYKKGVIKMKSPPLIYRKIK